MPVAGAARLVGRPRIEAPAADAHKYTRGLVLVVAGLFLGESGRAFAGVGFMVIPLALLAMTSYAGERIGWARVAAVVDDILQQVRARGDAA